MGNAETSDAGDLAARATGILERLVAFDTVSRNSNLELIGYVETLLAEHGTAAARVMNEAGDKASLHASIGPRTGSGVVLSGHSDVVPVDGQDWTSDPFTLSERSGRLYGRGTADMKTFLALALAALPHFAAPHRLKRPVHFAFSYDEEVGCLGAPAMIDELARELPRPVAVIVGEPTNMKVVNAHKGISAWQVTVTGHEAHSSLTHLGISANMVAARLIAGLDRLARELEAAAGVDSRFTPAHATLTIGEIHGGTAVNILAGQCRFVFDLRCPPGTDSEAVLAPFIAEVEEVDAEMKRRFADTGIALEPLAAAPALAPEPGGGTAETLARELAGDNSPARAVPYAAEAGQFQQAGFSVAICGPGSIEQAHQPDEYIEKSEIERGARFMLRLAEHLSA